MSLDAVISEGYSDVICEQSVEMFSFGRNTALRSLFRQWVLLLVCPRVGPFGQQRSDSTVDYDSSGTASRICGVCTWLLLLTVPVLPH